MNYPLFIKFLLPVLFLIFGLGTSMAQSYRITTDPALFTADVQRLMEGTRVPASVEVAAAFESTYNSLPEAQKEKIVSITQLMLKAKLKARPHYEDYFSMISSAVTQANLTGPALDNLLSVTEQVIKNHDKNEAQKFLSTSALFLRDKSLYISRDSRMYTGGGSFEFAYIEEKSAAWDEEPAPAAKEEPKAAPAKKEEPKKKKDAWADDWGDDWGSSWDKPATKTASKANDDDWGSPAAATETTTDLESAALFYPTPMPIIKGAVLKLNNTSLAISTAFDSTIINNSTGNLLLTQGIFVGKKGTLRWADAGHPDKDITCRLNDYSIDISKSAFTAELVMLAYPEMLEDSVQGNLDYLSIRRAAGKSPSYPRFISITNNARVKNLGENISYKGGFSLVGQTMLSNALDESPATIIVTHAGQTKFRATSRSYAFGDSLIASRLAAISIYQNRDSVSHPGMKLKYNKNTHMLTLLKDDGGYRNAVFYDSFHKIEIKAEMVKWDLNSKEIDFSTLTARTENPVVLESEQYFTPSRYFQTGGVMTFHPLQVTTSYAEKKKTDKFYDFDLASANKLNLSAVKDVMATLARNGYIDYNGKSGLISLKPRIWHYVESARGKKDYDNLKIESINEANKNATLNLETNDLTVRGVERFYLSDSLGVYVEPKNKEITIKKNRDIVFDGSVYSGNFQFQGTDFQFNYNNFWVDMEKIDKISFVIQEKAAGGKKGSSNKQSFGSPTQHATGKLFINKPNNKSNRKRYATYPYFDAQTGTNMYFNRAEVLGGVYDTSIFFNVPPFTVDSLDRKSGNNAIDFKGTFYAGDIFPAFDENLHVMPDHSLGFDHKVPEAGYPVFGKGTFFNKLSLNSGGIRGNGKLNYLNATLLSDDFVFYNDSVTTRPGATATLVKGAIKGVYLPEATVKNYWLRWDARADSMYIGSNKDPIHLYNNSLTLQGYLNLTPGGLYGSGATENQEAKITSSKFHFKEDFFNGRHSTFAIKGDGKKAALRATDALVEFDIKKRTAQFSPETEGVASITFPALQYKTSLSGGKADFNTKVVTMQMPAGSDICKSYFYSTHPGQDSLAFLATGGVFDMQQTTLNAYGVPYIAVLDSYIIPDSGKVYVTAGANMRTLHNASIIMDSAQKYHRFSQGELNIKSRRQFSGKALYRFTNAGDEVFHLPFDEFRIDSVKSSFLGKNFDSFTRAHGYVEEAANFYITPGVLYKGEVEAFSNRRDLKIKGYARFAFREDVNSDWFKFEQDVNPASVGFSVDKLTSADGEALHTGLHISSLTGTPYGTFASKKADDIDLDVLKVTGVFSYDKKRREYVIGNQERVLKGGMQGNIMRYNDQTSGINFGGKFTLFKPNKNFAMESGGYGVGEPDKNSYKLTLTVALSPAMPSQAVDAMANNLVMQAGKPAINAATDSMLIYRLAEFVGDKEARQYRKKSAEGYVGWAKFSNKLVNPIMLSEVEMHWSQEQNAWYSKGPIGVSNIGKQEINKFMPGHFEVRKTATGNVVSLYLETNPNNWYFMSFADSVLTLVSSDYNFNAAIEAKASKKAPSATNFAMLKGDETSKFQFIAYFRNTYLGQKIDAGSMPAPPPPTRKVETDGIQAAPDFGIPEPDEEEDNKSKKKKEKKEKKKKNKKGDDSLFPEDGTGEGIEASPYEDPEAGVPASIPDAGPAPVKPKTENKEEKQAEKPAETGSGVSTKETPAPSPAAIPVKPAGTENTSTGGQTPASGSQDTPTTPAATGSAPANVAPPEGTHPEPDTEEETGKKKKKDKKKKEEEPAPDQGFEQTGLDNSGNSDEPPAETEKERKKREKKMKKEKKEQEDEDEGIPDAGIPEN